MPKQKGLFCVSGNNEGLACPFMVIVCEVGYCQTCQIYLDWQKKGQLLVICAWCSEVKGIKNGQGQSGISHGICPECKEKHFT